MVFWLLGVADAKPSVTFNETPDPIGQLDCAERLNDVLNLTVSAQSDQTTDSYVLELVVYTDSNTSCLTTLQGCPQIEADDEGICGCLESRDGSPSPSHGRARWPVYLRTSPRCYVRVAQCLIFERTLIT